MADGFIINMNLLKMIDARMLTIEEDENGDRVDGVFIPLERNGVKRTKKGAYINVKMTQLDFADIHHHSHYLQVLMPREKYNEYVRDLGYKPPILGYAVPSDYNGMRYTFQDRALKRPNKRVSTKAFITKEEE
jgi:hypothetical protein